MAEEADKPRKDIYGLSEDDPLAAPAPFWKSRPHEPPPPTQPSENATPAGASGNSASEPPAAAGRVHEPRKTPIDLESVATIACPKCGAPMPGAEEVVCLRCGFDLSAAQQIKTQTGVEEVEPDTPEEERKPALTPPGKGGLHLPAIIAGVAILIMTIAFLAGADGLYDTVNGKHLRDAAPAQPDPEVDFREDHPGFGKAFMALIRFYVLTGAFVGSAIGGLYLLSKMRRRKIGDTNLAAMRALAIVCASELFLLFGLDYGWGLVEWIIQFVLMAAAFIALARLFFKVDNSEAAEFGGVSMLILAMFVLVAEVIA